MPQDCFRIEAVLQEILSVTEDIKNALFTYEEGLKGTEGEQTEVTAWLHSQQAHRDLIRGAIQRRQNG